ncbi:MAG: 3-phosphoshikimate 1-carboxyvinyltransferase [Lachnospiraceae bacterium]|nr:3-phosphoshikimate 1-carboxyvinyltransferase [Lachnospiraceae bacterium]
MKKTPLHGELAVPGDKSISHRSIMLGALAKGTTRVENFLQGADCLSTIDCFRAMGISIENHADQNQVLIHGRGLHGLTAPGSVLDCGNSGTTTRLISGILAAQPFASELTGDASIRKRPMGRIITPLTAMGADISSINGNGCAPLRIRGQRLTGIHYQSPVASAQVKSSVLLAGLYADGTTTVTEPYLSRNHTERMLEGFGAKMTCDGTSASLTPPKELFAQEFAVPGDISSAAYFITAAALIPGSELLIRNVGVNPTRDGILRVYRDMGADISLLNERTVSGEPVADLLIRGSLLHGTAIGGSVIPALIDELPIIAVATCFAEGETVISDATELKVKESNRIAVMTEGLSAMGADVTETEDGMIIRGGRPLKAAVIDSCLDHRIAMSFTIAGLLCGEMPDIRGGDCVRISYPSFYKDLQKIVSGNGMSDKIYFPTCF